MQIQTSIKQTARVIALASATFLNPPNVPSAFGKDPDPATIPTNDLSPKISLPTVTGMSKVDQKTQGTELVPQASAEGKLSRREWLWEKKEVITEVFAALIVLYLAKRKLLIDEFNIGVLSTWKTGAAKDDPQYVLKQATLFSGHPRKMFGIDPYAIFVFYKSMAQTWFRQDLATWILKSKLAAPLRMSARLTTWAKHADAIPFLSFPENAGVQRIFKLIRVAFSSTVPAYQMQTDLATNAVKRGRGEYGDGPTVAQQSSFLFCSFDKEGHTQPRGHLIPAYDVVSQLADVKLWWNAALKPLAPDMTEIQKKFIRNLQACVFLLTEYEAAFLDLAPEFKYNAQLSERYQQAKGNALRLYRLLALGCDEELKFMKDFMNGCENGELTANEQRELNRRVYGSRDPHTIELIKQARMRAIQGDEHAFTRLGLKAPKIFFTVVNGPQPSAQSSMVQFPPGR